MNVIILVAEGDPRLELIRGQIDATWATGGAVYLSYELGDVASLAPGQWTIVRRDSWQHDQRVIDQLRRLCSAPGIGLVDPTGLLGGSRYGFDTGREEKAPIVQRSLRGRVAPQPRSPAEPPPPRKRSKTAGGG